MSSRPPGNEPVVRRERSLGDARPPSPPRISILKDRLGEMPEEDVSLARTADERYASPYTPLRRFKQVTGLTMAAVSPANTRWMLYNNYLPPIPDMPFP